MRHLTSAACAAALFMVSGFAAPAGAQTPAKVSIALVPSVPSASSYLALDKGYFRDAGLDVTIERIDSLSKAVAFIATNKMQVGQGGINAGYFNSVATGLPLIMALESGSTPLNHKILVRNELKDVIKTVADLKGRRVAVSSPGSTSIYEIGMVLKSAGLRLKDIDLKYVGFSQMGAALANGAIDAAVQVAPFTDIAVEKKLATEWIDPEDGYIKELPLTNVTYIANTDWIKSNPDVAKRFFLALAKAGRDYCQAYHGGPNRAEVIDVMIRNKVSSDRALIEKMEWQARSPDGRFRLASVTSLQDFYKDEGIIEKTAPADKLIDESFADNAAKAFGPFEVANKASTLKGCR